MFSLTKQHTKIFGILGCFAFLAIVGMSDYATGYELSFFIFYLLPILFVHRYVGSGPAFGMALLAAVVWLFANIWSGQTYSDLLTPIWNTGIRLAIFILVIILFTTRDHLKMVVDEKTAQLRQEIRDRTRLEKELLEIAELEQRRIGHDLHDSLGQHLTATAMAGKVLAKKLASKSVSVDPAAANQVVAMVEEAIELTRNLARTLHPVELGAGGLEDALQTLAASLSKAFALSCRFEHSGSLNVPDKAAATHLYRIAQEATSNAIRHGHARNILIKLATSDESIELSVKDDGTGLLTEDRKKKGMGLRIMSYRADMIGGTFDIQNQPGGGTRAVCVLDPRRNNLDYDVQK